MPGLQVLPVAGSKTSWRPVGRWTSVSVSPTRVADGGRHSYTVDGLRAGVYYQLDVRAFNDLDGSPALTPPFVFYTHKGKGKGRILI